MFFGTPHQGTNNGSNLVRGAGSLVTNSKEGSVLRELKLWSPWTIETNSLFAGIAEGFTMTTYWEKEDYCGVKVRSSRQKNCSRRSDWE